jgi:thiol:disulfide interchange protein DsbD
VHDLPAIAELTAQLEGFGSIYVGVLAMGFFYGLTLCSFSCLPLITPYIFGTQAGFRAGFDVTAIFIIARVAGYSVLGALSGFAGQLFLERIGLQVPMMVAGILILFIALLVLFKPHTSCKKPVSAARDGQHSLRHMATLGIATSLMPCPPLYAVMLYGATTQSMLTGATLAFLFGLGTSASPLYYIGGATSWLSGRIGQETAYKYSSILRSLSGVIIATFGIKLFFSGISG